MKLRNKKTGEVRDFIINKDKIQTASAIDCWEYDSLAKLNEEWEDYEEAKVKKHDFYYINENGGVLGYVPYEPDGEDLVYMKYQKEIGNHFKTIEEANKAVEKLKAWKRLKDKGFRFTGINDDEASQELITQCGILCEADIYHLAKDKDFLLLFGGEE